MSNPKLKININKDDDHINDFLYCWSEFGSRPNKIVVYNTYSTIEFNNVISEMIISKNIFTEIIASDSSFIINDKIFVKIDDGLYLSYVVIDRNQEKSIINEISFFYKDFKEDGKKVQDIIDKLNSCILEFHEKKVNNLNTIIYNNGSLDIEPVITSECDIDNFNMYYSNNTLKDLEKLIKKIKKSEKGLSILYGERGTGKTSVINYISSKLNRIVIFIPNNMIEQTINNPDFRKFINKHYKPVIIIDDCEMMFNEAFAKSNTLVNNLLQIVDGFLSDLLKTNIILIFNVRDEYEIDHSLLDCNNLIDIISFEELSPDNSTELSKYIGHNKSYKNKTKLIDIIKGRKTKDKTNIGL